MLPVIYRKDFEISIHAPRGGSDSWQKMYQGCYQVFQSTLPVGGATRNVTSIG